MTFLPIVERELRVAARLTATYRNRVLVAGIVTAVAMVMLVFGILSSSPSQIGRGTFWTLTYLALAFCLLEGVRQTADCLSEEKREGTLGLLFLTDLKGYDIVLGKLTATSLTSIYGLVAVLPVLALPLLLGGVTAGEFWRTVLALANILFLSLCAGMLVSAVSRQERRARTATFIVVALIAAAPLLTFTKVLFVLSPLYAFHIASAANYFTMPQTYWRSIELTQAESWLLLLLASLIAPRCWQDQKTAALTAPSWNRRPSNAAADSRQTARRAQMLDINPAFWLACRSSNQRPLLAIAIAVAAVGSAIFIYVASEDAIPIFIAGSWVLNFVLKLRVAAQSCHCLAEARRNNALEMLLSTPLSVDRIIEGQMLALKRTFLAPIITIFSLEILSFWAGLIADMRATNGHGGNLITGGFTLSAGTVVIAIYIALFTLDIFAVVWSGMWFGLSSKSESQAVTKTILFGLVLPLFGGIFICYGIPFIIGIPIFLIAWSSQKLRREFRALASTQYQPAKSGSWIPGL